MIVRRGRVVESSVELMAEENTEVLVVESESNRTIIGILPYKNILNVHKHRVDEYENHRRAISLKRMLKVIINGKKITTFEKRKES